MTCDVFSGVRSVTLEYQVVDHALQDISVMIHHYNLGHVL